MNPAQKETGQKEILPVASAGQGWAWLARSCRARAGGVTAALVVGLVGAVAAVVPVWMLGVLVDKVVAGAGTGALAPIAAVIVAAALVGAALVGLTSYLVATVGESMVAQLREDAVAHALALPATDLERIGKGDLLSRTGSDVAAIGKAVGEVVPTVVNSLMLGAVSLVAMAAMDWRLGLAGAVSVPLYVVALRWYLPRSAPRYALERRAVADRAQALVESMQGARTVRAYRVERAHLAGIDAASGHARDLAVGVFTLFTRFVGRVNRAEFVGLAVILGVGFHYTAAGVVTVGQTTAAALLFHRLFNPVGALLFTFDEVQAAGAGLCRLVGVIELAPRAAGRDGAAAPAPADAGVELDGVRFGYGGGPDILKGVTLRLAPGERVALVGSTGAGKSTLAGLAAGVHPPRAGAVRIGGVDLAGLAPGALRAAVALVSQEVHVFAGPLREDLLLARPGATDAQVRAALAATGALAWVDALAEGLGTAVGEGGRALTAAQAQQLALTRVLLADPAVVVLDEATAEAGSYGAREIEAAAAAVVEGRTALVVAHRLTQAALADRVVVLEHGEVVEDGPHGELLAAGGRYARLWEAWAARVPAPGPAR